MAQTAYGAISFATVYASLVSLVYVTWLFVAEPHLLNGTESQVELIFEPGSFMQMVDGIGYTFMGVAALFAAPCFTFEVLLLQLNRMLRGRCAYFRPGVSSVTSNT